MLSRNSVPRDVHDFFRTFDEIFGDAFGGFDFGPLETSGRKALPASMCAIAPVPSGSGWWPRLASWHGEFYPAVESFTRDGNLVLKAELPGVDPANVEVTVEEGRLVIRGEKKHAREADEARFQVRETRRGTFQRSFTLPEGVKVDGIAASLENGVLEVTVPVEAPEPARRIPVEIGKGGETPKK